MVPPDKSPGCDERCPNRGPTLVEANKKAFFQVVHFIQTMAATRIKPKMTMLPARSSFRKKSSTNWLFIFCF